MDENTLNCFMLNADWAIFAHNQIVVFVYEQCVFIWRLLTNSACVFVCFDCVCFLYSSILYGEYAEHVLRFFDTNIDVYCKQSYTRLNFEKYIDTNRAMDKITKELVQNRRQLAFVGEFLKFNLWCMIFFMHMNSLRNITIVLINAFICIQVLAIFRQAHQLRDTEECRMAINS